MSTEGLRELSKKCESRTNYLFGVFYSTIPGLFVNPAEKEGIHYLCEFDVEISKDAIGPFEIGFNRPPELGPLALLFNPFGAEYTIDEFQTLRLIVGETQPVVSEPPNGGIDPRHGGQDAEPTLQMHYNGNTVNVTVADFGVEVSGGEVPQIKDIDIDAEIVTLVFDRDFPAGACTTVRHLPSDWFTTVRSLPGDINGDGVSSPQDIIRLLEHFEGTAALEPWQCDVNTSGYCEPQDILALIDLLNGAGGQTAWNGVEAPTCP